jgi:hypothetical protein
MRNKIQNVSTFDIFLKFKGTKSFPGILGYCMVKHLYLNLQK